jgi:putative membrane protein
MVMRATYFFGVISASMVVMLLALAPGISRAANNQTLGPDEQTFLSHAISDNAGQIAMAKLALQKSQNPKVIALANAIIQERVALDARLVQLMAGGVNAVKPGAINGATIASLQALDGDAFDKSFAGLLVRDHNKIISDYECIKGSSTNLAVRSLVHAAVPELRGNLMAALTVLRSAEEWTPSAHLQAVAATDTHTSKTSLFVGEPLSSIVAAPW